MKKYFIYISIILILLSITGYFVWKNYYTTVEAKYVIPSILAVLIISLVFLILWVRDNTSSRVFSYGSNTVIMIIAVIGILSIVNYISNKHSYRNDFTGNKRFSISDQSIKIMKDLGKNIKVIAFYQDGDTGARKQLEDLMEEYMHYSDKINYEFVDPVKNPKKAELYGVKQLNTVVMEISPKEREKFTERVTEQTITNAILKLTRQTKKVVYFLTGHKEADLDSDLAKAKDALAKETYEVKKLPLLQDLKIPEDCTILAIIGPEKELEKPEISAINDYLKKGGKVIVMIDPMKASLSELLTPWNVEVGNDLILDFSGIGQQLFGSSEAMPLAIEYPMDNPITKDMKGISTIYPLARSVSPSSNVANAAIVAKTIIQSMPQSYAYKGELNMDTQPKIDKSRDKEGPVSMAVSVTAPVEGGKQEEPVNPLVPQEKKKEKEARIIVVGNSRFIHNDFLSFQGNGDMFLNMLGWLSEQEDLISIRPKNPEMHQLDLTQQQFLLIFISTLIVFPLLLIICGVSLWIQRR